MHVKQVVVMTGTRTAECPFSLSWPKHRLHRNAQLSSDLLPLTHQMQKNTETGASNEYKVFLFVARFISMHCLNKKQRFSK